MRNWKRDGWTEWDWAILETAAISALNAGRELEHAIGSGGGALSPDQLDPIIKEMETAIKRLKDVRWNY